MKNPGFYVTFHDAYTTKSTKKRDFRSEVNKMASSEEFFSRLRKLASTVDKETSELKDSLENSETSSYNENRACLLLRETLAEIKDLKVRNNFSFGSFPNKNPEENLI